MVHAAASALCAAAALSAPAGAFVPPAGRPVGAPPPALRAEKPFFCEAAQEGPAAAGLFPSKPAGALPWHRPFLEASRAYSAIATALEATPFDADAPPRGSKTQFSVPRSLGIVPENADSVQFTAGTIGSVLGLVVGGPILGALLGCGCNYLARKGDGAGTAGEVAVTASAKVLGAYNGVAGSEGVNGALDSALGFLEGAVDRAKESGGGAGDALTSAGDAWGVVAEKIDEFDLVGGARSALATVGDLVETGLDKVGSLNDEYKLTDRVGEAARGAADQVSKFE